MAITQSATKRRTTKIIAFAVPSVLTVLGIILVAATDARAVDLAGLLALVWLFMAVILYANRFTSPAVMARKMRSVSATIIALNAKANPIARACALVEFPWHGGTRRGGVRMSELPANPHVGQELTLWIHPEMAEQEWPELFYDEQLNTLADQGKAGSDLQISNEN